MIRREPVAAEEVLELLGRDTNEPVVITTLAGGYRNLIQRVEGEGFDWIVKQYSPPDDNPLFPLMFEDEWRLMADYAEQGIAPRMLAIDRGRRLLVYQFVEGSIWDGDLDGVAVLLSKVERVEPRGWLRSLPATVHELRTHTAEILHAVVTPPAGLLDHFDVDDEGFELRLVHTDCGPGNIIGASGHYILIDWQCPGRGDPVEDLAAFISPGVQILYGFPPLTDDEVQKLLDAYQAKDVVERFRWKAPLYSARFAAYCAWRIERLASHPDADLYRQALAAEMEALRA